MIGGGMKIIWDGGVSNTISDRFGNGETISFPKIFCRAYIIYDSRWECCKKRASSPSKETVNGDAVSR